jgi:hypothetical protein
MKLNYKYAGGRDLYADKVECTCLDPHWKDTDVAHLFKRKISLSGYADDNFFDNVNKEPCHSACECGRKFRFQWFRSHVEFEWEK